MNKTLLARKDIVMLELMLLEKINHHKKLSRAKGKPLMTPIICFKSTDF
jgi:hypothetical protein